MTTKSDLIYEQISNEIKSCDYQRRSLLEQMDRALEDRNIESLAVHVYKYKNLSDKIEVLKKIMYEIESEL